MYGGRPGSIASFSFRLLLAELPMHCGRPKESLTKLFSILAIVRQVIQCNVYLLYFVYQEIVDKTIFSLIIDI